MQLTRDGPIDVTGSGRRGYTELAAQVAHQNPWCSAVYVGASCSWRSARCYSPYSYSWCRYNWRVLGNRRVREDPPPNVAEGFAHVVMVERISHDSLFMTNRRAREVFDCSEMELKAGVA